MNDLGKLVFRLVVIPLIIVAVAWPGPAIASGPRPVPPPPVRPPLIIEEYRLVDLSQVDPANFEMPMEMPPEIQKKRDAWMVPSSANRITDANQKLRPFGYRFSVQRGDWEGNASLYRGNTLLVANAGLPYRIDINASATDFVMVIDNTPNIRPIQLMVTRAGTTPWDSMRHALTLPAFHGDALLILEADIENNSMWDMVPFQVKRNGLAIYEDYMPPVLVDNPMKGLWGWDGHWVVEVAERLIWDGYDITQMGDVEKAYEFSLIKGQPFYFFERDGQVNISYATWEYPTGYDEVWHYRCCGDSFFNPVGTDRLVSFYARKNNAWWYVEAGIYD